LRTDNDPNLRRFAELLNTASNASDVIRDALRLYALYQDGELALPETLPVVAEMPAADEAEFLSPEDIFGF
jgi:Arc/MetJ-type ribon-helix-helix transcriptional regulator